MHMDGRTRVLTALRHEAPDRAPTFFRRMEAPGFELTQAQRDYIDSVVDVGEYLNMRDPEGVERAGGVVYDELGVGRRNTGLYMELVDHPLAHMEEPEELDDYPWPDVSAEWRVGHLKRQAEGIRARGKAVAVMGSWGGSTGVFELSWYMRGLEEFLCDCMINLPFAERLLDIQLRLHMARWEMILGELGELADIACLGDDLGTQTGPLLSPKVYRELIKPRQRALIRCVKELTSAPVYFHSCGAVDWAIPDFIEMGVDILDPVQPNCLPMDELKQKYGRELCFYGGIDVQNVLPFGTPEQVRSEVLLRFEQLGQGGGLILGPSHWMQPDVPFENMRAMYETIRECRY